MENINFNDIKCDLSKIVQAIAKATGPDIREFMATSDHETDNCIRLLRGDFINTNLRDMVEGMELHSFKRYSWDGRLLIDRRNNLTYSICTKQTLDAIPKTKDRHIPHYLQTILHIQNTKVKPMYEQMTLPGMGTGITVFDEDEYREDYKKVMGDDLALDDNYTHLVVTYEAEHGEITYIAAKLLDPNCNLSKEWSLMDLLKPDYIDLTVNMGEESKTNDTHDLIAIKPSLIKAKEKQVQEPLVSAKQQEGEKQA